MGIMDKIKFWKKDDDLSLDENPFGNSAMNHSDNFSSNNLDMTMNQTNNNLNSFNTNQNPENNQNILNDPLSATEMIRKGKLSEIKQETHPHQEIMQKDMEILSSKLDAIKSGIESMNQRLQNIERMQKEGGIKF